jgi:hypothetical protein
VQTCPYTNRAYRGVYLEAYWRAHDGESWPGNPYRDHRSPSGRVTFSRGFIRAFDRGWIAGRGDRSASQDKHSKKGVR